MKKSLLFAVIAIAGLSCKGRSSTLSAEPEKDSDANLVAAEHAISTTTEFINFWSPALASDLQATYKKLDAKIIDVTDQLRDPKEFEKSRAIQAAVDEFGDNASEMKVNPYSINKAGTQLKEYVQFTLLKKETDAGSVLYIDKRLFSLRRTMGIAYQILPVVLAESGEIDVTKAGITKTLAVEANESFHYRLYLAKRFFDEVKAFEVAKKRPTPEEWAQLKFKYGIID